VKPAPNQFEDDIDLDARLRFSEAGSLRRWLFNWLLNGEIEGNYSALIERWVAILIIANLLALVFEHVPAIYQPYAQWFHIFDVVSVYLYA